MFARFAFPWFLIDASRVDFSPKRVIRGTYELERTTNPFGYTQNPWLMIKGTMIGAPEMYWRQWQSAQCGEFRIQLSESEPHLDDSETT
jgi:hypothetical protein